MGMGILERMYICQNADEIPNEFVQMTDSKIKSVCSNLELIDHFAYFGNGPHASILQFRDKRVCVKIYVSVECKDPENLRNFNWHIVSWHIAPNLELNPSFDGINLSTAKFLESVRNLMTNY